GGRAAGRGKPAPPQRLRGRSPDRRSHSHGRRRERQEPVQGRPDPGAGEGRQGTPLRDLPPAAFQGGSEGTRPLARPPFFAIVATGIPANLHRAAAVREVRWAEGPRPRQAARAGANPVVGSVLVPVLVPVV